MCRRQCRRQYSTSRTRTAKQGRVCSLLIICPFLFYSRVCGAELSSHLSTEAIVKSKPYVHESKADSLKQEEVQEDGNASVGPAPVDQQQPLQEPELGEGKVCILHRLTSFHSRDSHADVSRWGWGRTGDACEKAGAGEALGDRLNLVSPDLLLIMFTSLAPSPMDMVTESVCFLTRLTMSAFCPGVTRQHSTDWH